MRAPTAGPGPACPPRGTRRLGAALRLLVVTTRGAPDPRTTKSWSKAACAGAMVFALARAAHAAAPAAADPHELAVAALKDLRAAVAAIVAAEEATSSGPAEYRRDARRAIHALDGEQHRLNALLDRVSSPPWVPAIHGVQANTLAAEGRLDDALQARGLADFEVDVSQALLNLQVAIGRSGEPDVLGGLRGAMASTELGVPAAAQHLDACAPPRRAGYGVHDGYWLWRAVRLDGNAQTLRNPGGIMLRRTGDMLVFYTPAAQLAQARCVARAAVQSWHDGTGQALALRASRAPALRQVSYRMAQAPSMESAVWHPGGSTAGWVPVALHAAAAPPFTAAQAQAGKPVYQKFCVSCHGSELQGVAAPALAGHDFLSTAQNNGWTLGVLRTIVTQNMPFNNPGSLDAAQYADVIAYLLASNCYAAGRTPFPQHHSAALASMHLPDPPAGARADSHGVCKP